MAKNEWVEIKEVREELGLSRSTLDLWRTDGRAPEFRRFPNGKLKIRRTTLDNWLDALEPA